MICGSYLDLTGADLAIENAGGIRGGIAAGDVTAGNVIAISPYGHRGDLADRWTRHQKPPPGSRPCVSHRGINVTIDWTQPEGKRIVKLTKDGSTLDPAKTSTTSSPTRPTSPPSQTPPSTP